MKGMLWRCSSDLCTVARVWKWMLTVKERLLKAIPWEEVIPREGRDCPLDEGGYPTGERRATHRREEVILQQRGGYHTRGREPSTRG